MKNWVNWFAWYPVAFGPHIIWLKTIQKCKVNGETWFRVIPSKQGH